MYAQDYPFPSGRGYEQTSRGTGQEMGNLAHTFEHLSSYTCKKRKLQQLGLVSIQGQESRSVPEKAVDDFTTNAQLMRYPAFRAQGLHVGSGIAEAACKTVVETRAKRAGIRWMPEGLDALLPLRTAKLNHTFDEFWQQQSRLVA